MTVENIKYHYDKEKKRNQKIISLFWEWKEKLSDLLNAGTSQKQ